MRLEATPQKYFVFLKLHRGMKICLVIIMNIKVAVILSGCGVYDGSEIHESVLTLLALPEQVPM